MTTLDVQPKKPLLAIISFVILGFLTVQSLVIIMPVMFYYWPFMDYPMYSPAHYENELVDDNYELLGVSEDGKELQIKHKRLDLSFFQVNDWLVPRLLKDRYDADVTPYLNKLVKIQNPVLRYVKIQAKPVKISRSGLSKMDVKVFKVIDLQSIGQDL